MLRSASDPVQSSAYVYTRAPSVIRAAVIFNKDQRGYQRGHRRSLRVGPEPPSEGERRLCVKAETAVSVPGVRLRLLSTLTSIQTVLNNLPVLLFPKCSLLLWCEKKPPLMRVTCDTHV